MKETEYIGPIARGTINSQGNNVNSTLRQPHLPPLPEFRGGNTGVLWETRLRLLK